MTRRLMFSAERRDRMLRALLAFLASAQLALGAWMVASPHSFFDTLGGFGVFNEHYVRDVATWYLALGLALVVAVRRASWRVPVLALATVQYVLHFVNHLVDAREADPSWAGPADAVLLAGTALLLAEALRREARLT